MNMLDQCGSVWSERAPALAELRGTVRDWVGAGDLTELRHVVIRGEVSHRPAPSLPPPGHLLPPGGVRLFRAATHVRGTECRDGLQARLPAEHLHARHTFITSPALTHDLRLPGLGGGGDLRPPHWLLLTNDVNGAAALVDWTVVQVLDTHLLAPPVRDVLPQPRGDAGDVGHHQHSAAPGLLTAGPPHHLQGKLLETFGRLLGVISNRAEFYLKESCNVQ